MHFSNQKVGIFPKRFLSWGFKTLFASASSCQCKPPHFSSPAGLCRVNLDQPRSSGAHKILTELLCREICCAQFSSGDSTEIEFYLHRDACAAAIRVLATQRWLRGGKKSGGPGVRTQDLTIRTRSFDHLVKRVPIQNGGIL